MMPACWRRRSVERAVAFRCTPMMRAIGASVASSRTTPARPASRGLGTSDPAQLDEALKMFGAGQNLLSSREAGAATALQAGQNITLPALALTTGESNATAQADSLLRGAGVTAAGAQPSLLPTSAAYDSLNTAYNAQAAANIVGANNRGSVLGGMMSY